MTGFLQALTFTTPLALAGLLLLPVIWWLLRFTPPRPETLRFPPLRLLLELVNRQEQLDKTPWWLMLLRLAIAALVIIGVAHPLHAPGHVAAMGGEPLLLIVDDSWAAARHWDKRQAIIAEVLDNARRAGATVTLATTTSEARPVDLVPLSAAAAGRKAATLEPKALDPDYQGLLARLKAAFGSGSELRIVWIGDGVDRGGAKEFAAGLGALANGNASVEAVMPETAQLPLALATPAIDGGRIEIAALRAIASQAGTAKVRALAGNGRDLADATLNFAAGGGNAKVVLELPVELRNEVQRIEIEGERNAAATFLFDDRWRRKSVALQSGTALEAAQPLLSPLYYVSRALEPYAELAEPADARALKERLDAGLSMLVLADIGVLPQETAQMVASWLERGGVLVRFAGPRLAGAQDGLIPVRLREGGRELGSALSWETPQALQPFPEKSPFAGLTPDGAIRVTRQVLAEPDNELPDKVWASLEDGTPLVTAERKGKGLVVLFHVTANADWSNLPLTGLFVEMLRRVADLAPGAGGGAAAGGAPGADAATAFSPRRALSGHGELIAPLADSRPIALAAIDKAVASPEHPAGLYVRGAMERAINIAQGGEAIVPVKDLPSGIALRSLTPLPAMALAPFAFAAAVILFLFDCIAALTLGGGWRRLRMGGAAASLLLVAVLAAPDAARAQDVDDFALRSTLETHFAYVLTGDAEIDRISEEGLKGLGVILKDRTSVEPGDPMGINIERDEIVFFPMLYWPVRSETSVPSDAALARIDAFMKNGGTIFFDLRDDGAGFESLSGGVTASTEALRRMLAKLDIPPLESVPAEHVLTKAFYLLQSFPGRYDRGQLWVERADAQGSVTGNADGVSSIIIGSNDYAAAWAVDDLGRPLYAAVPGNGRQREMAYRAGINIVMYVLTGNYKADQVHVPALLERLGQ
ncbi:MAG: DUF4159 domain-containing protein [Hyphomicrobiales bacterium]